MRKFFLQLYTYLFIYLVQLIFIKSFQISSDYSSIYEDNSSIFDDFDRFSSKIIDIFEKRIKDPVNKEILVKLQSAESITEGSMFLYIVKVFIFFSSQPYLIHYSH